VDVKDVKVRIKPELDDEFAKDIKPELNTLADLKEDIRPPAENQGRCPAG
jgi:trigger factor